jgi:hypothetical protein
VPYFTEPEQVVDYLWGILNTNKAALGLGYVGYSDELLLPKYPAAVVSFNAPVQRELGPTGTFTLTFALQIIVYHARLTTSHKTRTKEDMQLAAAVREKLHEDYKLGGGVIFGFVESERPGVAADAKGRANIATVLFWAGSSRAPINA